MEQETKEQKQSSFTKIGIIAAVVVFVLWGLSFFLLFTSETWRGTFGDMFGSVNALFSGLALAGVVIAIIMQSQELKLQREELRDTREELKGQKEQLTKQADFYERQMFENSLFQLIRLYNDNVDKHIMYENKHVGSGRVVLKEIKGRYCFKYYVNILSDIYSGWNRTDDKARDSYIEFYHDRSSELDPYLQTISTIIVHIHSSKFKDEKHYANIIVSQFSTDELIILFYACISVARYKHIKPLIEYYCIFRNLDKKSLLDESHQQYYTDKAFGQ